MDEQKGPGEGSMPPDGPSVAGRSLILELEESFAIEADLKLRELGDQKAAAPTLRPKGSRYQLLGTVGTGGMGTVHLAYDHDLKRRVAMKVINARSSGQADFIRRFLEEAQATGQLEHPNIVPIYDVGRTADGSIYYTMRFVHGISLERVLQSLRRGEREVRAEYTVTRFLQILQQVAMAVHFAHEKGVVHRDLKPSNLMLGTYGEVLVMDWGLARILGRDDQSGKKRLIGTPAYMSPEQAAGLEAGPQSDVFALGIILYKCLTLRAPFHGLTLEALLADIRRAAPAPPRRFHPRLPAEMDRITLTALARDPGHRYPTARAFRDALQAFLEGAAERRRRFELAEKTAALGRKRVAVYLQRCEEQKQVLGQVREVEEKIPGWWPLERKRELILLKRRVEEVAQEVENAFGDAVESLSKALGHDPSHKAGRASLAELYMRRFRDAEAEGDEKGRDYFRRLVETYHDGRFETELRGDGNLEIQTEPSGAAVYIAELAEEELRLRPSEERFLGRTPLSTPIAMGSYLVTIRADGKAPTRYPLSIGRLGEWKGTVQLYTEKQIGEGFVYVPAGYFIQGGDRGTMTSLPRANTWVDSFFISRYPVTNEEYLEFLNDLARHDREEALRRAPRRGADGGPYWRLEAEGFRIPDVDPEGDRHDLRWPVLAISWHDARAYCAWRSKRDGRLYTLPSEAEWEKAARGVDARIYPWGNRFDPAMCNVKLSRQRAGPVPVGTFVDDESPYGVRDMAGNCEEWTADEWGDSRGSRVSRGGAWVSTPVVARACYRSAVEPHMAGAIRGFRLLSRVVAPG